MLNNYKYYFAIILAVMALFSCEREQEQDIDNKVSVPLEVVAHDHTGQFISIESSQDWEIVLDYEDGVEPWCQVKPAVGSGSLGNIVLSYSANEGDKERKVYIDVIFEKGELIEKQIVQESNVPAPPKPDVISKWGELPTITNTDDLVYVSHTTTISNKKVRNYSMQYDKGNKIALWVAYPLCDDYLGHTDRTDSWGYDPKIPAECQPDMHKGFPTMAGLSGIDRGHQLPSADRTSSYNSNAATFYYSNQTAQVSNLNQGVWANLESRVRGYASLCDTLYVVTGPILKMESSNQIDSIFYKSGGFMTAKPKAYFKVLVKYSKGTNIYNAIGFWYENRAYDHRNPVASDAHSIKEIEKRTGLSFFNNLPISASELEKLKNEYSPSTWGLSN